MIRYNSRGKGSKLVKMMVCNFCYTLEINGKTERGESFAQRRDGKIHQKFGPQNIAYHHINSKSNLKDLDELERGQFNHRHDKQGNMGNKGLHFPHPLHGHPPFFPPYRIHPQTQSKMKYQSQFFDIPFFHMPPPVTNPAKEFKFHKNMRKTYTTLHRRDSTERRIKITAYIAVVVVAIVVLIVVGAAMAIFFHVNSNFLHNMMTIDFDSLMIAMIE